MVCSGLDDVPSWDEQTLENWCHDKPVVLTGYMCLARWCQIRVLYLFGEGDMARVHTHLPVVRLECDTPLYLVRFFFLPARC